MEVRRIGGMWPTGRWGLRHSLDLKWRAFERGFVKFAGGEMTGEDGLSNNVGRFGIADQPQGFESAIRQRGLEVVIKAVVGNAFGDHDHGIGGLSDGSIEEGIGQGNGVRCEGGKNVAREQGHTEAHEPLLDAFLFERKARPVRDERRGRDQRHRASILRQQFGQHAAHVIMIVIVDHDA